MKKVLVNEIKLPVNVSESIETLTGKVANNLKISKDEIKDLFIKKKSIDARHKPEIFYVYSLVVSLGDNIADKVLRNKNTSLYKEVLYNFPCDNKKNLEERPVIIGFGPAGLFCGYLLALHGFKPVIIERGSKVESRTQAVKEFWEGGKLNLNTNVQFGEGGAGTFSDGKLNTGVKDKYGRIGYMLDTFVKYGADKAITYINKPHIGTDVLTGIISSMRRDMEEMGANFYFDTLMEDFSYENGQISSISILLPDGSHEKIKTNNVVLAIGHSARNTFKLLHKKGIDMQNKPFAVGYRVQHKQKLINDDQYGFGNAEKYNLPASDYKLTYTSKDGHGVYSFCMCPGGYVVNASSFDKKLTINGMSYSGRDSDNANSAIVITVNEDDYGHQLFDGMKLQEELETKSYNLADGKLVFQRYEDYKDGVASAGYGQVKPVCKGQSVTGSVRGVFSEVFENNFIEAMEYYGGRIKGFNDGDSLICAVESRTSSPVKIIRDDGFEANIKGIYPCGEGAGYAGGITSAAVDGMKVAEQIAKNINLNYT